MEWFENFKDWFLSLGGKYNVNPYIFGGNLRRSNPIFLSLSTGQLEISRIKNQLCCLHCLPDFFLFRPICIS